MPVPSESAPAPPFFRRGAGRFSLALQFNSGALLVSQSISSALAEAAWLQAVQHYEDGRLHEAHRALHRYLSQHRECGRGWELLGLIYHSWKTWKPALAALEEASVLVPLSDLAECAMADCYQADGRKPWARSLYDQLLRRQNVSVAALLGAATGLDLLGESRPAVAACRRAIKLDPEAAQPYFSLSFYLGRCGALASTIEAAARRAIHLAPENLTFRTGLAGFLHLQGRARDAVALLHGLTEHHVQLMNCRCCLDRLIGLFEVVADEERAGWCRRQSELLLAESHEC